MANVEEMLDTEDIFAFAHFIGHADQRRHAPHQRPKRASRSCSNSSGFPLWGDPANYPWNTGDILDYSTETAIWCTAIKDEFGEGATVAALIMNNDFGKTYEAGLQDCAADGGISIAGMELHDPAAPDVTNEMTTLVATDAECPWPVRRGILSADGRHRGRLRVASPVLHVVHCGNLASFFARSRMRRRRSPQRAPGSG